MLSESPSPHRPNETSIPKVGHFNHAPWLLQLEVGAGFHAGSATGVAAAVGGVVAFASVAPAASANPSEPSAGGVALASMKVEVAADEGQ